MKFSAYIVRYLVIYQMSLCAGGGNVTFVVVIYIIWRAH